MDDEGLIIFMCEVELIVNGCFIMKLFDDLLDFEVFMLSYLLLLWLGLKFFLGVFRKEDGYF